MQYIAIARKSKPQKRPADDREHYDIETYRISVVVDALVEMLVECVFAGAVAREILRREEEEYKDIDLPM
jgi:hypothetical protein